MSPTLSFIIKETRHITRDRRTMLILFGMPVVMMLLFGFAIRTDLRNVNLAVLTSSMDNRTQQIIDRLNASEYFTVTHCVGTPEEARRLIVARKADMAVAFTPGFANHRYDATAGIQLITDYADPNTGEMQNVYAQQIISVALASPAAVKTVPPVNSRLLYNPQMKSAYNFVPGIMGMLLILICAMMTSVSIVREKERGTMEVLLASPVRPIAIIIAKAIPYMLLSIGILISIWSYPNMFSPCLLQAVCGPFSASPYYIYCWRWHWDCSSVSLPTRSWQHSCSREWYCFCPI